MEFLNNIDWFMWLIIVLSLAILVGAGFLIAKIPPHQDARPKGLHAFFVADDDEIK